MHVPQWIGDGSTVWKEVLDVEMWQCRGPTKEDLADEMVGARRGVVYSIHQCNPDLRTTNTFLMKTS